MSLGLVPGYTIMIGYCGAFMSGSSALGISMMVVTPSTITITNMINVNW
jgi:hypothetical protein